MPHKSPRTLTYLGETLTIPAWSRRLGIPESTILDSRDNNRLIGSHDAHLSRGGFVVRSGWVLTHLPRPFLYGKL